MLLTLMSTTNSRILYIGTSIIKDHNINQVLLDRSKSGIHTQTSGTVFDQTDGSFTTQNNNMLAIQTNDSELNQGSRNKRSLSDVTEQKSTSQINNVETTDVTNTKHLLTYKEPRSISEAKRFKDWEAWKDVMNKEMNEFKTLKAMVAINLEEIPKDANIVK